MTHPEIIDLAEHAAEPARTGATAGRMLAHAVLDRLRTGVPPGIEEPTIRRAGDGRLVADWYEHEFDSAEDLDGIAAMAMRAADALRAARGR